MKPSSRELWWALGAIGFVAAAYLLAVNHLRALPQSSTLFGHGIGVIGFVLMLATETLYSLRKRSRQARWGRTASWLRFHIVTGLVGPFMVLLHASWRFNGLAGVVTLLTGVTVVSGFIGRYIYTAVPRTSDGLMMEAGDLQAQIAAIERELHWRLHGRPGIAEELETTAAADSIPADNQLLLVLGRTFVEWEQRRRWRRAVRRLDPASRAHVSQLEGLIQRRRLLHRQAASLIAARRLLGLWHSVHIPIGMVLFTAALIHMGTALFFVTSLR